MTGLNQGALTDAELRDSPVKVDDDETQTKLDSVITELQALLEESVFTGRVGDVAASPTANTVLGRLKDITDLLTTIDSDTSGLATEATLSAVEDAVDGLEALLTSIDTELATQQKDALTDTQLRASDVEVNDDAAQTLLTTIRDRIGTIADSDTVNDLLDRILSELGDHVVAGDLQTDALTDAELRASDVEVNDDALQTLVGEVSATPTTNTVQDRLKNIYEAVDGLELSVDNIDIDMDDVEALLTTIDSVLDNLYTELQTQQKDALTDAELRATDVSVDDDAAQALLTTIRDRIGTIADSDTVNDLLDRILSELSDHVVSGDLQTDALTDTELRAAPVPISLAEAELSERMQNKVAQAGYRLWFDTADTSHLYILEAPSGTASSSTGFQGVRITLNVVGNPVGVVEVNTGATLTFDNRTSDGNWTG